VVLAVFAGFVGFGYRVVTAGVIGANIGGGLMLLATPVLALFAMIVVLAIPHRDRRTRRGSRQG